MKRAEFLAAIGGTDAIVSAMQADDCRGFCIKCGAEAFGVEPDARRYPCEACDAPGVFGASELFFELGLGV